jgi:predicted DsbA family dithiol-disulfide isomerase
MASLPEIRIDIVSDIVCPWCYIGYRQLERGMAMAAGIAEFSIRWHPFRLAPDAPPGGMLTSDYVRMRYGATPEQSRSNRDRITGIGESLGIDFRFGEDSRIYDTSLGHQLMAWASANGGQTALSVTLFDAYFTGNEAIDNPAVLANIALRAGLDAGVAAEVLASGEFGAEVDASVAHWQDQNVTGVPAYILNGSFPIPGAQDAETFAQIFEKVAGKLAIAAA